MNDKSRNFWFEPVVFLFFGIFLGSRIWAFFDRQSYADFFINLLINRGILYYIIMVIMAALCIAGITAFFRSRNNNNKWRWIYLLGGGYVLFDLFAIAAGITVWNDLLIWMFDIENPYWNLIWAGFSLIGCLSLVFGVFLLKKNLSDR